MLRNIELKWRMDTHRIIPSTLLNVGNVQNKGERNLYFFFSSEYKSEKMQMKLEPGTLGGTSGQFKGPTLTELTFIYDPFHHKSPFPGSGFTNKIYLGALISTSFSFFILMETRGAGGWSVCLWGGEEVELC